MNFNRMFSDKNPVNLNAANNDRHSRFAKNKTHNSSPAFESGVALRIARERSSLETALMREKTLEVPKERLFMGGTPPKHAEDVHVNEHEGKVGSDRVIEYFAAHIRM